MANSEQKQYKIKCEKGYYLFKLENLLYQLDKSRYALSKATDMDRKLINRYIEGDLSRFDARVIARICDFCNCKLEDIIEYIPNSK